MPAKLKDPRSLSIFCYLDSLHVQKASANLGASFNVMSYELFKKLNLGEPKPCNMHVSLADKLIGHSRSMIENSLLRVDDFIFPIDFFILDMRSNIDTPLILERPFLSTLRAIIDMH